MVPALDLTKHPIKEAEMNSGEVHNLVHFFRLLRCNGALPDIEALSKRLTEEYIRNLRRKASKETRRAQIREALSEIMQNPDQRIAESIIGISSKLSELRAKPEELLDIWLTVR
jgi:hypothetical protein